jgi:hypothetical protein
MMQRSLLSESVPPQIMGQHTAAYEQMSKMNADSSMEEYLLSQPADTDAVYSQLDRYTRAIEPHHRWSVIAKQCVDFFEGRQWTDEQKRMFSNEGRQYLTLNKINPLVRLILGYFRQNRYDTVFLPGNNGQGVKETAEVLTAIAKQISERNQTKWLDAQVFQDGLVTSRGFWDIRLDFDNNILGEVKEKVDDPFTILIDPEAEDYDTKEWGFVMEERWMRLTDIFLLYGDKQAQDVMSSADTSMPMGDNGLFAAYQGMNDRPLKYFGNFESIEQGLGCHQYQSIYAQASHHTNRNRKLVKVIDCQHYQLRRVSFLVDLDTGVEQVIPDTFTREQMQRTLQYARGMGYNMDVRTAIRKVVRWTTTAGNRLLFDDWSPYDMFTKVPYFAYFRRGHTRGMVEDLIDPQMEVNKRRAAMLAIVMTTANSGWKYQKGSLDEDMRTALEEEGARPGINIEYNKGFESPVRIEPAIPPSALQSLENAATADLKEISGINDSAMGILDRAQSGVAVEARQRQAIVGAEVYFDNFERSRENKARMELHIVQRYYTEERIIRTQGNDGQEETFIANQKVAGAIVNSLSIGNFEIAIDTSPMSATFQQSQFDQAVILRDKGIIVPDDMMVDLSSMPNKTKIKKRLEEQKLMEDEMQQLQVAQVKMQMGLDPSIPAPAVYDDGIPSVTPIPQQPSPVGGGGNLPPQGAPMIPPTGEPPLV